MLIRGVIDPLTGLPTRQSMDEVVVRAMVRSTRLSECLALALIDVDRLREINQRYLFTAGDKVLVAVAKVIRACLRPEDCVGRIGGDRFLVVAPNTNRTHAERLGEDMRLGAERQIVECRTTVIPVTVSIGVAVAKAGSGVSYDQLKCIAATLLVKAKADGRNRVCVRESDDSSIAITCKPDDF